MEDILDSVSSKENAWQTTKEIKAVVKAGGFKMKSLSLTTMKTSILSKSQTKKRFSESPGSQGRTAFEHFEVKLNFSQTKRKVATEPSLRKEQIPKEIMSNLTKRMILSQVNSIYDPLQLAGPFTDRAKIMMQKLWGSEMKLDWDDHVPEEARPRLDRVLQRSFPDGRSKVQEMHEAKRSRR
ncbi:Hypothetical predicted protein [Paramuricea clavata]|uniref:Uncharacterized protein n=1 Tax=Paramuricea clavata TaxID=317549 RepID=A0A7D9IVK0_PARCT|nr:Hypothetical predicted protein [Paramuricea clavata]